MYCNVSVVILSYNRKSEIKRNIYELCNNLADDVEILVVDNFSDDPVEGVIDDFKNRVKVIRLNDNVGIAGRNIGVESARGDYVITLDDDVFGLTQKEVKVACDWFENNPLVSAINFKIIDDITECQINWIHHRDIGLWSNKIFETYEISEGAVAFRKKDFLFAGGYPEHFFISHEGPDLAVRIIDMGKMVIYNPEIVIRHAHSINARVSWRRYYYDVRNIIWMAVRNYPFWMIVRKLFVGMIPLFLYSLRDGYFKYWVKGAFDGVKGIPKAISERKKMSNEAVSRYKDIEKNKMSTLKLIKIRLFSRQGVRI